MPIEVHAAPADTILNARKPDPCAMVIFGATGDLTHRKLAPALYNLAKDKALPPSFALVGFSRSIAEAEAFRASLRESVERFSRDLPLDEGVWREFAARIETVRGNPVDLGAFAALRKRLEEIDARQGTDGNRLFYFATPPGVFPMALGKLREAGLLYAVSPRKPRPWSRVIVEKPFGRDLDSARELNRIVTDVLDESQVFRIDHYLGKETVQNILVLRFGNGIFEPLWNRQHIDHVQITAAEDIGVEGRGDFYDKTGVVRDMVQNHLLQILAFCAMEPTVSFDADDIRDAKVQVLRSLRPVYGCGLEDGVVFGQHRGYRREKGVAPDSRTPTYAALKAMVDNWRWQGIPFYLRAGKRLACRRTEVAIQFRSIPFCLFGREDVCQRLEPNVLTLRIQPNEGIAWSFAAKTPGDDLAVGTVTMDFDYAKGFKKALPEAYERLLLDCMRGDATLFDRRDSVEWAWKFVTPILEAWESAPDQAIPLYEPGSSGPAEADRLIGRDGRRWRALVAANP